MGDATASITVLDTRSRMTAGIATNTNPLWIKGLGIRVPMHRELRSDCVSDFAVVGVALGVEADIANRRPVADLA